jgi:hypothetical protein
MFKVTTLNIMNNEYWEPASSAMGGSAYHYFREDKVIPLMFAWWGNKDKKKVYEKDILYDGKKYYVVEWDFNGFYLLHHASGEKFKFEDFPHEKNVFKTLETVGNFFQNYHLLKEGVASKNQG